MAKTQILRHCAFQHRLSSTLVVSEPIAPSGSSLPPATMAAISAAGKLHDGPITVMVVAGSSDDTKITNLPSEVKHLIIAKGPSSPLLAETVSEAVKSAQDANSYSHIVGAATKFGGNFLPRAGALLGVSPITDVIEICSEDTFVRPLYAGNALAKVESLDEKVKVLSVRPTAFEKALGVEGGEAEVTEIDVPGQNMIEWVSENVSKSDRPELVSASVVVSGGRGMKSGENFPILEELADKLGGAVGASRAAVDAGYVPNDLQVGQTGKVVAPDLYIAVGISGAIQHLSGMKDSKTIVAINKDPEAPIFQVADYGLVADLFDVVPEITEKV